MSGHLPHPQLTTARPARLALAWSAATFGLLALAVAGTPAMTLRSQLNARLAYDDNVHLQDFAPNPAIAQAAPPKHSSLVASVGAKATATWKPGAATELSLSYAPEAIRYLDASSENHDIHALQFAVAQQFSDTKFTLLATATAVDGSDIAPVFGCAGGAPALGAPTVRDRRDGLLSRATAKLQIPLPWGFVRPLASVYAHDFQTVQRVQAGYMNYIDRSETLGGIDVGARLAPGIHGLAGFRYGRQEQKRLHGVDSPYDSIVRRFVIGAEATWKTLRLQALGGPELRSYPATVSPLYESLEHPLWIDVAATWSVSPTQTCVVAYRRQQLPSSASLGMYDDSCLDATWRAQFSPRWSGQAGVKLLRGDWVTPNAREDRVLIPTLALKFSPDARFEAECGWTKERGYNRLPGKSDREYNRNIIFTSFAVKL